MAYTPPFIDAAGLHLPSYNDVIGLYTSNIQSIYGPNEYLGNDAPLFQMISIFALSVADAYAAEQLAFNNHGPNFAIGPALDSVVKNNGLTRKSASFSTCAVTVTGTASTVIPAGLVRDSVPQQGALWSLPANLTIPGGGTINTIATCQVIGALNVPPGQLNLIATPTSGWAGVTNAAAAVPGQPVESDAQLRARQAISTETPSITIFAGTVAAVAAVPGVTRSTGYENPTNATDSNGNPAHSVTMVVEGGANLDIATAIFNNRGIGPLTNGTTSVNVTDPSSGIVTSISFSRPVYVPIYVTINLHALAGYTTATGTAVLAAVTAYLNSLAIGELVTYSALVAVATNVNPNLSNPLFAINTLFFGIAPSPSTITNVTIAFDHVAQGILGNMVLNLV
jgi:uncharacterized phage protein gp47/JayE